MFVRKYPQPDSLVNPLADVDRALRRDLSALVRY